MAGTITITAGTTYSQTITITDSAGDAIDITGATVKFKIARNPYVDDDDAVYYISSESASHLTLSDPANGICTLIIPAATTKTFTEGIYSWQIRYIDTSSNVNDTDEGTCKIEESLFDDES